MKYAEPGEDRTSHGDRHEPPKTTARSYRFVQDVPEYTKVIEAENVSSQVDAEAEFNRDPTFYRGLLLLVTISALIAGCLLFIASAPSYNDDRARFEEELLKERDAALKPHVERKLQNSANTRL